MRYLSLFSGIGGFELGIQRAYGVQNNLSEYSEGNQDVRHSNDNSDELEWQPVPVCVGYSEIDKYAISIYEKHFPNHKNYGDITKINPKKLPDFDLLVGGFPCQAFSIAGKRKGFKDTRGTLFFEIARIVRAKRPRLLLLENVKGLLSHDDGKTFYTIVAALDELGYDVQWQVLNSKNHGVPQNRERVFIVGHLRGTRRPQVFPFGQGYEASSGALGLQGIRQTAGTLRATDYKGTHNNVGEIIQKNHPRHSNNRVYDEQGISPTINTAQGGDRQPKIGDEYRVRRLTPTECERLQGFPDGWTEGISDTQRYKCLGNAVTVNVIQAIMDKLRREAQHNV